MKKLSLSVVATVIVALLACGSNLFLDDSLALSEGGGTPMSTSLITGVMRQRETASASTTTTASTTSTTQAPTTQPTTTQAPTTTTPTTTQAPAATEPPTEAVVPQNVNYGTDGRLYVPRVGISVALYYYDCTPENFQVAQSVTDRRDSATCCYDYGVYIISDHRRQEFGRLLDVVPGDTAYIDYPDGTRTSMKCVSRCDGYNNGWDLLDDNGDIATLSSASWCDVIMRTCLNSNGDIRLTYWQYV